MVSYFHLSLCSYIFELLVTDFPTSPISEKVMLAWPTQICWDEKTPTPKGERTLYLQLCHVGSEGGGQNGAIKARRSDANFRSCWVLSAGLVSQRKKIKMRNTEQE